MSWVAVSIGGGAALGAASGYLSGSGGQQVDSGFNAQAYAAMNDDQQVADINMGLYRYGSGTPYGETPTPVYKATGKLKSGWYKNTRTGQVMTEATYLKKSRNGKKDIEKYGWAWVEAPLASGVSADDGQMRYQENQQKFINETQPAMNQAALDVFNAKMSLLPGETAAEAARNQAAIDVTPEKALADIAASRYTAADAAANQGLIPARTQAQEAQYQHIIDTTPEKAKADIAGYQYTQQALPEKWNLVQTMSRLAGRNTETEAARMAGAEVSQAYNAQQRTLADDIRRTGAVAGSGRMAGLQADLDRNRVKDTAGARIAARNTARNSQYDMLSRAVQLI